MEEVIGSIPIRSTNHFNNSGHRFPACGVIAEASADVIAGVILSPHATPPDDVRASPEPPSYGLHEPNRKQPVINGIAGLEYRESENEAGRLI